MHIYVTYLGTRSNVKPSTPEIKTSQEEVSLIFKGINLPKTTLTSAGAVGLAPAMQLGV